MLLVAGEIPRSPALSDSPVGGYFRRSFLIFLYTCILFYRIQEELET